MDVSGISAPSSIKSALLNRFQLGERLLVEVVNKINEGEGTVRVKGQNMHALLETTTQIGEKFWVKVGSLNEGGLLLIRESTLGISKDISLAPQQFQQVIERGLSKNQEIIALLKSFPTNMGVFSSLLGSLQGTSIADELLINLKKAIPQWNSFSDDKGIDELLASLKKLGLNYEQRIQQIPSLDDSAREIEKQSLLETFKGMLLKAIQSQTSEELSDSDSPVMQLLQKITGQQLWFKSGALDNAYVLLHIPFFYQEDMFVPVQIALESARKGQKMDEQHCRIAILADTQELGEIGIDAYFNENSFTCKVLSKDLTILPELLKAVIPETKERFAKLGFHLERVEVGEIDQNLEFEKFLKGSRRTGVDISR